MLAVVVVGVTVGETVTIIQSEVQQATNKALDNFWGPPNISIAAVTASHALFCGRYDDQTAYFTVYATLVNTGGPGVATVGYEVDGKLYDTGDYYVDVNSHRSISDSFTVYTCPWFMGGAPISNAVVLSERSN